MLVNKELVGSIHAIKRGKVTRDCAHKETVGKVEKREGDEKYYLLMCLYIYIVISRSDVWGDGK